MKLGGLNSLFNKFDGKGYKVNYITISKKLDVNLIYIPKLGVS